MSFFKENIEEKLNLLKIKVFMSPEVILCISWLYMDYKEVKYDPYSDKNIVL